jgi:hypothetical protein
MAKEAIRQTDVIKRQTQVLTEEQVQKVQTHVLGDDLPRSGGLVLGNELMYGVYDTIYNALCESDLARNMKKLVKASRKSPDSLIAYHEGFRNVVRPCPISKFYITNDDSAIAIDVDADTVQTKVIGWTCYDAALNFQCERYKSGDPQNSQDAIRIGVRFSNSMLVMPSAEFTHGDLLDRMS